MFVHMSGNVQGKMAIAQIVLRKGLKNEAEVSIWHGNCLQVVRIKQPN